MRLFQQQFISGLNDMEDDNTPELWRGGSRVGFIRFAFWEKKPLQEVPRWASFNTFV